VDTWDVARRELTVAGGPAAVLAVAENANDGWVATVDGHELGRTRVDGWQQAWVLPAGGEVTVSLEFVPDQPYRQGLLIGALAALALIALLAVPVRRRIAVSTLPGGTHWVPAVLVGLLVVLGGMPGVIALLVALLLRTLWPPAARIAAPGGMVVAAAASIAGRLSGHGQEWAYGWLAQGALLFAVAAAVSVSIPWFDQRPKQAAEPDDPTDELPAVTDEKLSARGTR
jgi:arabinofuranan 3-O-arabinosyltransferase